MCERVALGGCFSISAKARPKCPCLAVARPTYCSLTGCAPVSYCLFIQSRLRAMPCENLGLHFGELRKFFLQSPGDSAMDLLPTVTQQGAVGDVLKKRMFEHISGVWGAPCRNSNPAWTRDRAPHPAPSRFFASRAPATRGRIPVRWPRLSELSPWLCLAGRAAPSGRRAGSRGPPARGTSDAIAPAATPSPSASSSAFVISSTNSGCRRRARRCPAGFAASGLSSATRSISAVTSHGPRRLSVSAVTWAARPGRREFGPEGDKQQGAQAADPVQQPAERLEARRVGPVGVLEDHQGPGWRDSASICARARPTFSALLRSESSAG